MFGLQPPGRLSPGFFLLQAGSLSSTAITRALTLFDMDLNRSGYQTTARAIYGGSIPASCRCIKEGNMPLTLVNPMNEAVVKAATPPPRLDSLAGKKIALLDISKPRGSFFLDR